jgi:bacillopeptidase F (M6 metalloprotease family)
MKRSSMKKIKIVLQALIIMTVFVGIANAVSGQIEENAGVSSLGSIFYENFESGWGNWYASNGVWEVGTPTAGPTSCHNGTQCAGTNLAGNYPVGTDSNLISPSIQLPQVNDGEEIHLRFWQWFSYAGGDYGQVQVSVYNTSSTGNWDNWQNVGAIIPSSSPLWSPNDRDMTKFTGKKIRIAFAHTTTNPYGQTSTGWYIDDVVIINRRGDLNRNGIPADAGDLVLMKRASIGEIPADSRYDLNNNGQLADAGDLVLMKRASIGEINL